MFYRKFNADISLTKKITQSGFWSLKVLIQYGYTFRSSTTVLWQWVERDAISVDALTCTVEETGVSSSPNPLRRPSECRRGSPVSTYITARRPSKFGVKWKNAKWTVSLDVTLNTHTHVASSRPTLVQYACVSFTVVGPAGATTRSCWRQTASQAFSPTRVYLTPSTLLQVDNVHVSHRRFTKYSSNLPPGQVG